MKIESGILVIVTITVGALDAFLDYALIDLYHISINLLEFYEVGVLNIPLEGTLINYDFRNANFIIDAVALNVFLMMPLFRFGMLRSHIIIF